MEKLLRILLCGILCYCLLSACHSNDLPESPSTDKAPTEITYPRIPEVPKLIPKRYITQRNEYWESGEIAREIYFERTDDNSIVESERYEYAYDEHGNLISITHFSDFYPTGSVTESREYDARGLLHKVYRYGALRELYEYNTEGNLIKEYCYDSGGDIIDSEEHIYQQSFLSGIFYMNSYETEYEDSEGNYHTIIERSYYYEEYDKAGRISKVTIFDSNEEPFYEIYTYSNHQTIITEYSLTGTPLSCMTCDYDDQNREIRRLGTNPNGTIWFWHEFEHAEKFCKDISYSSDGTMTQYGITRWDEHDRIVFEALYDNNGSLCKSWDYSYDNNGYITAIVETDESGNKTVKTAPWRDFYENGNAKTEVFYNDENYIAPIYRDRR